MIEFAKTLSVVPAVMDGPIFQRSEQWVAKEVARAAYVKHVQAAEERRQLDDRLSAVLSDENIQAFAHAFWLYEDGRMGFCNEVLKLMERGSLSPLVD